MKHVAAFSVVAILGLLGSLFCSALLATPALTQELGFGVTPVTVNLEVPGGGTVEAQFTIVKPKFTGQIAIGLQGIPLDYEPKTVSVEEGVNKTVVLTFHGNVFLGTVVFRGEITFLPTGGMFVVGYKIGTQVTNRVSGEPITFFLTAFIEPPDSGWVKLDPPGGSYPPLTEVSLTAIPYSGYVFDHWSGDASGTDAEVTLTMDWAKLVTAHFTPVYNLTVSIDPLDAGSVTLSAQGPYTSGTQVTLTAAPAAGYVFDHWSGDASGTDAEVTITMDSDKAVTAHFRQITYSLNVSIDPEGSGSVTLDPAEGPYPSGIQVTLTAEPASGYAFDHWSGDASGSDVTVTITMDSDKTVVAHFTSTAPAAPAKAVMVRWAYVLIGVLGGAVVILLALWLLRRRRRRPA